MKEQIKFLILVLFVLMSQTNFSQSTTPVEKGEGMNRMGFVHRYNKWVFPNNVLAEWKKNRGGILPNSASGLLTNPYRSDGTGLSYGITIPANFTGKIPVFTEGNWWPTIGSNQTAPLTYSDLDTDTGATYNNGEIINNSNTTRRGIDRIKIVNKTPYSYLVSSGLFPGNEQPGQVMTIISPNGNGQLPIPPKDWWEFNFNGNLISAVPEVYSSVAGLNPLDAPGWKHSSWSPRYTGGIQAKDFGTGGFAYTFGSLFGRNDGSFDLTNILFAGFNTNEGYDPLVSGDPGYGCAFYINGEVQAVMDISLTTSHTAQAILIAQSKHNPGQEKSAFDNSFSHLKSIIGIQPSQIAEIHYITHSEAKKLIAKYTVQSNWVKAEKKYQSNTQAKVNNIALPDFKLASNITLNSCTDGIQNGNETGIDCGGSCGTCKTKASVITGKFVPNEQGTLLAIGQDIISIGDFSSSMSTVPAALSGYTSIGDLSGIETVASYGSGPQHLSNLATNYPNSGLVLAVYLVDQLNKFNSGALDANMDLLIDKLVALDRPIYLRWGYEFDGTHNHYNPKEFVTAWKKMYTRIKEKEANNNIAMVWHSGAFCGETYLNQPITSWYPGSDYVDLMAISVFTPQDCNYAAQDAVLNFARNENKPVIIAEATPQGYDVSDSTIAPVLGNNKGVKASKPTQQIWDEWYQPFFNYIESNKDVIRLVTYINANWDSQGFWKTPYNMGYWGDSRVQENNIIKSNWNNIINAPQWVKGSKNLFNLIGFRKDDNEISTCTDNIKNGDETNIDCGGTACKPCETTPTCSDNIKNGDETDIDCGGTACKPCKTTPTCSDNIKNGDETDIDCGGTDCKPCETTPTCSDNIKNGDETDIDCGGTDCKPCETTPTCSDNIKNGDETDIDCGGSTCVACTKVDNTVNSCGEFGISYIAPTIARVFHKDLGFKSNIYVCIDNNCYTPILANGYYYFDFSKSTTSNSVIINLNQKYTIEFKADFAVVAKESVTFTTQSCDFENKEKSTNTKDLILFPNPSYEYIELIGENITDETLYQIFTINGKKIKNGKGKRIDISSFSKGLYLLITDKNEQEYFLKK